MSDAHPYPCWFTPCRERQEHMAEQAHNDLEAERHYVLFVRDPDREYDAYAEQRAIASVDEPRAASQEELG